MRRLFAIALIFSSGCRLADASASIFGAGKTPCSIVLNYCGDVVNPIGGYADTKGWLSDPECLEFLKKGTRIDIVKLGLGKIGTFTVEGFSPPSEEPPDEGTVYAEGFSEIRDGSDSFSESIIGVFDPMAKPRKTEIIPSDNRTYRNITRDFLKGQGLGDRGTREMFVSRVVKVDLEVDGTDEVFRTGWGAGV